MTKLTKITEAQRKEHNRINDGYHNRRETKRKEAKERQTKFDSLTLQEKFNKIQTQPGNSKKQLDRINKLLEETLGRQIK